LTSRVRRGAARTGRHAIAPPDYRNARAPPGRQQIALTFAHTMGEFGVVLMVGGNIPGETKTVAIAIYDRAQAFDQAAAGAMSATLLVFTAKYTHELETE
jgi:ABC-type sulfate transport system permease component